MSKPIANEEILQREPVVVTSADHLESIVGLVHDEYFELSDVSFSKDEGVVSIPYRRMFHGHPGRMLRNWLICRTFEVDVIRSMLTIRNVKDYTFDDKSRIGTYSFNTISYDNGAILINCCEDLDLHIFASEIRIESRDLEVKGKARISRGLFWESSTSKVYD
jgi:hypothetical protein